jgi:hypothetical protein
MTMPDFPTTAADFYRLRDDRTNRCPDARDYQTVSVAVTADQDLVATRQGQVMLMVACNLLSRWCRRVILDIPNAALHPSFGFGPGYLGDFVLGQMRDADPFGSFGIDAGRIGAADLLLSIGIGAPPTPQQRAVYISANDWLAAVGLEPVQCLPATSDGNVLGAIAACCLGVGQLFKLATCLPDERLIRDGVFDLFTLDWSQSQETRHPGDLHAGRILMVGAGSVGSSAAYCMRMAGFRGEFDIVDHDTVKVENFNRSPIFGRVSFGTNKAVAISNFLSGTPLKPNPCPMKWNNFLRQCERASMPCDLWLPLANEDGVRNSIQSNVPPLMIHASTGADWAVYHGRHIPGRDDCLADRFPEGVQAGALACSTSPIPTPQGSVDAALPFASLFAGLLVAADIARSSMTGYPQVENYANVDWHGKVVVQKANRLPRPGCACLHPRQSFHDRFNADSKHRHLFRYNPP